MDPLRNRRASSVSAGAFLLWAVCFLPIIRAQAEAPTVDQLRDAAQRQREAIQTLRIRERETVDVAEPPEYSEARDRDSIANALRSGQQGRIDVDEIATVKRLNRHLSADVERTIDRQASKALVVFEDSRDVAALAHEHGLSPTGANNLDRSRTLILEGANHTVLPTGHRSAVVRHEGAGELSKHLALERLGIIPAWVFDEAFSLDISPNGESSYRITGRHESLRSFEIVIDASKDYRVTSLVRFDDQDRAAETYTYSNYERVDGIWVPKAMEAHVHREGISDFRVSRWQLLEAQVNPTLPPETFRIPEGYHVQYLPGTRSPG